MTKTKRNEKILKLIYKGKTYLSIGEKFGVSKQCVRQIALNNGVNRLNEKREVRNKNFKSFLPDIKANVSISEIAIKHSLTKSVIRSIYKAKTGLSLNNVLLDKRNQMISKKFISGKTARKITTDSTKTLDNPQRISTVSSVYSINAKNGVKRYPEVGNRNKGGTFQNKRGINLIVNRRDKGWSFGKILEELNKKGIKTVTGLEFMEPNIRQIYNYAKTKLNK